MFISHNFMHYNYSLFIFATQHGALPVLHKHSARGVHTRILKFASAAREYRKIFTLLNLHNYVKKYFHKKKFRKLCIKIHKVKLQKSNRKRKSAKDLNSLNYFFCDTVFIVDCIIVMDISRHLNNNIQHNTCKEGS